MLFTLHHVSEDALDEVNVSLGQETALQRDNLAVCQFSLHIIVTNSQLAIATDSVPLPVVSLPSCVLLGCPVVLQRAVSVSLPVSSGARGGGQTD